MLLEGLEQHSICHDDPLVQRLERRLRLGGTRLDGHTLRGTRQVVGDVEHVLRELAHAELVRALHVDGGASSGLRKLLGRRFECRALRPACRDGQPCSHECAYAQDADSAEEQRLRLTKLLALLAVGVRLSERLGSHLAIALL